MTTSLRLITEPVTEPVTLEEARLWVRLDAEGSPPSHPEDDTLETIISSAREHCESFTGRLLTDAEYELRLDSFPVLICFPITPVLLSEIAYMTLDVDEVTQIEAIVDPAVYVFDDDPINPTVRLATDQVWPTPIVDRGVVRVRFSGIYGSASSPPHTVPHGIRLAMRMLIAHWYANREAVADRTFTVVPMAVDSLLRPFRLRNGFA